MSDCDCDKLCEAMCELEAKLYDAYGLGIDDGIEMQKHPHGLGGKTRPEVIAALEEK